MGDNMEVGLVITALDRACVLRSRPEGVIFHSLRAARFIMPYIMSQKFLKETNHVDTSSNSNTTPDIH
jgi:hypothetical protein